MCAAPAAPPVEWAEPVLAGRISSLRVLPRRVGTFCLVELQKLRHDRTELVTRAIQPILWLVIFGETFTRIRATPTGNVPYLDYLAPGIIAQSALFIAIFYGVQISWERTPASSKLLATPTPRSALVAGKAFAAGIRALAQVIVVLIMSAILGVALTVYPLRLLGVAVAVSLGTAFFACLSMTIAGLVLSGAADGHRPPAITMALFFASSALPGADHAGLAAGPLPRHPSELRGRRPARAADRLADPAVAGLPGAGRGGGVRDRGGPQPARPPRPLALR